MVALVFAPRRGIVARMRLARHERFATETNLEQSRSAQPAIGD
jgi:hypothetical protein